MEICDVVKELEKSVKTHIRLSEDRFDNYGCSKKLNCPNINSILQAIYHQNRAIIDQSNILRHYLESGKHK